MSDEKSEKPALRARMTKMNGPQWLVKKHEVTVNAYDILDALYGTDKDRQIEDVDAVNDGGTPGLRFYFTISYTTRRQI